MVPWSPFSLCPPYRTKASTASTAPPRFESIRPGRAVYVSNRGHDSIAAFTVDPSIGLLTPAGHSPTKECPRAFGVDPDGRFLYAGSDHSGRVTSHKIDSNGLLHSLAVYEFGMWPSWVLPVKLP